MTENNFSAQDGLSCLAEMCLNTQGPSAWTEARDQGTAAAGLWWVSPCQRILHCGQPAAQDLGKTECKPGRRWRLGEENQWAQESPRDRGVLHGRRGLFFLSRRQPRCRRAWCRRQRWHLHRWLTTGLFHNLLCLKEKKIYGAESLKSESGGATLLLGGLCVAGNQKTFFLKNVHNTVCLLFHLIFFAPVLRST